MTEQVLLVLTILLPLAGAAGIVLIGDRPNLRESVTLITAVGLFGVNIALISFVTGGGRPEVELVPFIAGAPIKLMAEPLGLLFGLIASGLWIVTSIYSIGYMRGHNEVNQTRFYAYFAVALAGAMGVAYAGNLITMFAFYEMLSLSTYPLVTHAGTEEARRGGRTYIGILIGTSIAFFLLAILWTWTSTGSMDFTPGGILRGKMDPFPLAILLGLFFFGIAKAGVMPFHRWLPAAMVAPTPVSALLHAVAVVKAGVFAITKIAVYIFGVDLLAEMGTGRFLMYVAAATIVLALIVALRQDNLKRRLAYSTISQLAYIVLGAMMGHSLGIIGGGMHIATHALGKITLFFAAGAILVALHKTEVSQMRGIGRTMPLTMTFFLIGSLSISGLPPTGGLWSKWYLLMATLEIGDYILFAVLLLSSILSIGYLMPIVVRAFFSKPETGGHGGVGAAVTDDEAGARPVIREAPLFMLIAMAISSAGTIVLFFVPGPLARLVAQILPELGGF
ncbi:MAG: monovalent cation/H+ antiporter subunit D family protein [Proteobacteria bacterium]|nr:monovalent cation/H+ antiporter subunit D family protein [Pseudomonadota bacterium]